VLHFCLILPSQRPPVAKTILSDARYAHDFDESGLDRYNISIFILVYAILQCLIQIKMRRPMTTGARLIVISAWNVGNVTRCAMQQLMNAASHQKFSSWPFKWTG